MKPERTITQYKLFDVLKTFSKEEYAQFGKMVISPFFSVGRNLYPLYRLIGKYHYDFESSKAKLNLTKENIFRILYPGKRYNEKNAGIILRKLFSDLNKLAEEFLFLLALKNNNFESENILTAELINRNLDASYKKHIKVMENNLKTKKIDEYYFRQLSDIQNLKYTYNLSRNDKQEQVTNNVIKKGEYSVIYSLHILGEVMQNARTNQKLFNSPYETTIFYQLAEKINFGGLIDYMIKKPGEFSENMILNCYRLMNILEPGNKELVIKFKELVIKNIDKYNIIEQHSLLIGTLGMIRRANFGKELFEFNKFILERGLYHIDKSKPFPIIIYRDLLRSALKFNELQWAESFIESYNKKLSQEYRNDMLHYGRAHLQWSRGNYENVLTECSKIKSGDAHVITDIKILTLRAYYELEAFEPSLFLIDSLILFFKQNKKISREIRKLYSDFAGILKIMLKYKNGEGRVPLEKIKEKIVSSKNMYAEEWLLEKINEL